MTRQADALSMCLMRWVVALLALTLGVGGALAQSEVGVVAGVRGSVEVQSAGVARAPAGGEDMFLGDRVRTQAQSGMQIMLLDESVFTIGESNDLVIDRFVYDPNQSTGAIAVQATQGFFRFVSGGIGALSPQNVELSTPSATIGVRGTSIDVIVGADAIALARQLGLIGPDSRVDPQTAVFVVLRGPTSSYGGITQRGRVIIETASGSVEVRREGFGVFVPFAGAPPSAPVNLPHAINSEIVSSIELPGTGVPQSVGGVDITELPSISPFGGDGFPTIQGLNPDVTGSGFNPCVDPSSSSDPCYKGTVLD